MTICCHAIPISEQQHKGGKLRLQMECGFEVWYAHNCFVYKAETLQIWSDALSTGM